MLYRYAPWLLPGLLIGIPLAADSYGIIGSIDNQSSLDLYIESYDLHSGTMTVTNPGSAPVTYNGCEKIKIGSGASAKSTNYVVPWRSKQGLKKTAQGWQQVGNLALLTIKDPAKAHLICSAVVVDDNGTVSLQASSGPKNKVQSYSIRKNTCYDQSRGGDHNVVLNIVLNKNGVLGASSQCDYSGTYKPDFDQTNERCK